VSRDCGPNSIADVLADNEQRRDGAHGAAQRSAVPSSITFLEQAICTEFSC
jgi:hypothetical protein